MIVTHKYNVFFWLVSVLFVNFIHLEDLSEFLIINYYIFGPYIVCLIGMNCYHCICPLYIDYTVFTNFLN